MNQITLEDGTIGILNQDGNVAFRVVGDSVVDLQGNIALRYRNDTSKLVRMGDGTEYMFVTKANACIAWVAPQHVDQVLAMKHQCCGGNMNSMFKKTNALTVYRWLGLGDW